MADHGEDEGALLRRCAWCGRVYLEGAWQDVDDEVVAHLLQAMTHTVCPDCAQRLRDEGRSR